MPTGAEVSIAKGVSDYYDAVLDSAGEADPFREYSSLTMPATMLSGRTLSDFLALTATVYDGGAGAADLTSKKQSTILGAGRPFIYPQMADLYGNLRARGYDVWVVSAGIGWAVRWMVQNALNPAIVAKYGAAAALPLDHVVAVTTLMKDRSDRQTGVGLPADHSDARCRVHQPRTGPDGPTGDPFPAFRTHVVAGRQGRRDGQHHHPRRGVSGGG